MGAAVLAAHLLAGLRAGEQVASLGEARLAAAAFGARIPDLLPDPLPLVDRFAARQIAAVETVLPLDDLAVLDAARWSCLAIGALAALLVWPLLRAPGLSAPAAALGVAVIGIAPPALALHAGVAAAGPAALWLTLAATLAVRIGGRSVPAAVAAIVAALLAAVTAPLAAAALLAFAAHPDLLRAVRLPDRLRIPCAVALALAAVATAVAALGSGPLGGTGGPVIGTGGAAAGAAVGAVLIGLGWWRATWLRPVFPAAALLLVVLLVPGSARAAAALLVLPLLAITVGVLADDVLARLTGARRSAAGRAAVVLVLVALVVAVLPARTPDTPGPSLVAWASTELAPGTALRADALDRVELVAAGFPAGLVRGPAGPVGSDELVVVADRPSGDLAPDPLRCADGTAIAATERGTGGAPTRVCRPDQAAVDAVTAERPARARLGTALVANPSLEIAPAAQEALRAGDVDARLVLVLAAMASAQRMTVADFPAAELDTPEVPRRRMLISAVDGLPATGDAQPAVRSWLDGQQPPFAPSLVRPIGSELLIGFPAPTQAGLLPY